ncbi:DNA-binding response regulator, partial [Arcobacter sp. AHV-9/2010]
SFDELVAALHAVTQGKRHLSADVYGNVVQSFVNGHDVLAPRSAWETLTARERSVLQLVAEGRTNRQVGQYLNLSPKTIEKYRAHLMDKLGVSNVTGLVLAAIDLGLIAPHQDRHADANPGADSTPDPCDPYDQQGGLIGGTSG